MRGECGCCSRDRDLKARGLCTACHKSCTLDGTLGNYGWVKADRLVEFAELRDRHYPVEMAGARVGVCARTAWRYEAALSAPVAPERDEGNRAELRTERAA